MDDTFFISNNQQGLMTLYNYDFITSMLKNNVTLYGELLRRVIIMKDTTYKYLKEIGQINGFANIVFKDIIERDLYEHIESIHVYENTKDYFKYVGYTLKYNSFTIKLYILYIINSYSSSRLGLTDIVKVHSNVYLDINLIQLDRVGLRLLYIPEIYINCPNPFQTICSNIIENKFNVLENNIIVNNTSIHYIYTLLDLGWKNAGKIAKILCWEKKNSHDSCSICFEQPICSENIIQLPCKHSFHADCWKDFIIDLSKTHTSSFVCCPECDETYSIWKILC